MNTFIQVHCLHASTDTVSIVPEVRVFKGQRALSLPHTTVPIDPPLSLVHYTPCTPRTHFPAPSLRTAQECKVHTLRGTHNTE